MFKIDGYILYIINDYYVWLQTFILQCRGLEFYRMAACFVQQLSILASAEKGYCTRPSRVNFRTILGHISYFTTCVHTVHVDQSRYMVFFLYINLKYIFVTQ